MMCTLSSISENLIVVVIMGQLEPIRLSDPQIGWCTPISRITESQFTPRTRRLTALYGIQRQKKEPFSHSSLLHVSPSFWYLISKKKQLLAWQEFLRDLYPADALLLPPFPAPWNHGEGFEKVEWRGRI